MNQQKAKIDLYDRSKDHVRLAQVKALEAEKIKNGELTPFQLKKGKGMATNPKKWKNHTEGQLSIKTD